MKTMIIIALVLGGSSPAFAWDGSNLWYARADADNPGGGGILGTGGAHDHGITCMDCHVERVDAPGLQLAMQFEPPLPVVSGMPSYAPGQRYTVSVRLDGHALAEPCTLPYTSNRDGFAAAFESEAGERAGALDSDSQPAGSCPQLAPAPADPGSTARVVDCEVIFSNSREDVDAWTFYWTAPAGGAVRIFYGAVDGDCDMTSMGDAVVKGSTTLRSPVVASTRDPRPPPVPSEPATGGATEPISLMSFAIAALLVFPVRRRARG